MRKKADKKEVNITVNFCSNNKNVTFKPFSNNNLSLDSKTIIMSVVVIGFILLVILKCDLSALADFIRLISSEFFNS